MFDNWVIGVMLRMSSNAATVMGQVAAATGGASSKIDAYQQKLAQAEVKLRQHAVVASTVMAGVGAAFIGVGVKGAAEFERAMTKVGIATGWTGDRLKQMSALAMNISGITAQDAVTIANEMAVAAQTSVRLKDPAAMQARFPQIAKFADAMFLSKNVDPLESVKDAVSFADLFKAYDQKALGHMLDNLAKLMQLQPESISSVLTQGRQFIPLASSLHVNQDDVFAYMGLMGETGYLRGRGGTGFQNVLLRAIDAAVPTAHLSKAAAKARTDLELNGFQFFDKNKNFRFQDLMDHLVQQSHRLEKISGNPARFTLDVQNLFGTQGGRFIDNVVDPQAQQQLGLIRQQMKVLPGVDAIWERFSQTFLFAWSQAFTNAKNVLTTIFLPALSRLTPIFISLAGRLNEIASWFMAHPDAGLTTFYVALGWTAFWTLEAFGNIILLNAALATLAGTSGIGGVRAALGGLLNFVIGPLRALGVFILAPLRWLWVGLLALPEPILLVVAGLAALAASVALIAYGPSMAKRLDQWWQKNRDGINYKIGEIFGEIARWLNDALGHLANSVKIYGNAMWQKALYGDDDGKINAKLRTDLAAEWGNDRADHYISKGYLHGYSAKDRADAAADRAANPNYHSLHDVDNARTVVNGGITLKFELPPGTTYDHIQAVGKGLADYLNGGFMRNASVKGPPTLANAQLQYR